MLTKTVQLNKGVFHVKQSKAKFYIYRNLHKNCFSVKYKGRVIAHCDSFVADNATTKVNQKTRLKVVQEKKKQVHAYVVCDSWRAIPENDLYVWGLRCEGQLSYNPYKQDSFTMQGVPCDGEPFSCIVGHKGSVYGYTKM
jgi:hypothetical protein